jgi:hypothetical protein
MKNEMDLMKMDERQRLAWFMANRGTLIAVGAVWLGMIGWELTHGRNPVFLLLMVPVFASLRGGLYFFYSSRPFVETGSRGELRCVRYGKVAASLLLAISLFLPIYSVGGMSPGEARSSYAWDLVREEAGMLIPLALIYLWPLLIVGLSRLPSRGTFQVVLQFTEPVLAVASSIMVLWIPQLIFEAVNFMYVLILPVGAKAEWGCYLAVAANALYLVSWLAGMLRPWQVQEG